MKIKRLIIIISIVVIILLIPFVAMQFTNEVNWTLSDFIIGGLILLVFGLLIELILHKLKNSNYKLVIIITIIAVLVLIWIELAVGLIGSPFAGS